MFRKVKIFNDKPNVIHVFLFFRHAAYCTCFFLLILLGSCGYHALHATPVLKYGIQHLTITKVENRSHVIGVEGIVRRKLEEKFIDYIQIRHEPLKHGYKQADLIIKLKKIVSVPTAQIIGTSEGRSLGLQKNALLASQYTVSTTLEIKVLSQSQTASGKEKLLHQSEHTFTSSFEASVSESDAAGAGRNALRNQLKLQSLMELVAEQIASNVFNILTATL